VQLLHAPTNFIIFGAIDDLWQNSKGEFLVVDYKATASKKEITELNQGWHKSYKRQMEVYQWLLRGNGYSVSNTGYFVYCNGQTNRETFDGNLEFDLTLIPYEGNDSWVEQTIKDIHRCLLSGQAPSESADCDYCAYRVAAEEVLKI
jgi:ATP-dependent exoDNAse (exonuclease V) beta subunit